jgi:hypothetical protein
LKESLRSRCPHVQYRGRTHVPKLIHAPVLNPTRTHRQNVEARDALPRSGVGAPFKVIVARESRGKRSDEYGILDGELLHRNTE